VYTALAEARKAIEDVMVVQIKELVRATRESETNCLEVHLKLFAKKMEYQMEKDQRLYEQGRIAAENARLAKKKQGELVECLSTISNVLHVGLMVSKEHLLQHQYAPPPEGP
jgi:hypothetical protein